MSLGNVSHVGLQRLPSTSGSTCAGNCQDRPSCMSFFPLYLSKWCWFSGTVFLGGLSPGCLSNDPYTSISPRNLRQAIAPLLMVLKWVLLGALSLVFPPESSCHLGLHKHNLSSLEEVRENLVLQVCAVSSWSKSALPSLGAFAFS